MKKTILKLMSGALASACLCIGAQASAASLDQIKERGVLKVGVKADYRPFGFLDSNGKVVGLEPDLAKDVASRLGVDLELVQVQTANRMEFLQQGRIDLIIATMSINEQRRRAVGVIEPYYYAGGTAALVRKDAGIKKWDDLKDKKICGTQGAYYNRNVAQKYGADIVAFPGSTEAQSALLTGSCIGFLQDSTLIAAMLADPSGRWSDYEMPLPVEDLQLWAVAVPKEDLESPFADFMRETVTDWHKSGLLIKKEKEWDLMPTDFVQEQHTKYKNTK
jgi:polar amino acid transport system substrate-binding protein